MLPPGRIIILESDPRNFGMMDATCDGNRVRVFMRDLEERAEPVTAEQGEI